MPRLALCLVSVALLAACGGGSGGEGATATGESASRAVELEGQALDGERLSLAEFRGKAVFVNVWASW